MPLCLCPLLNMSSSNIILLSTPDVYLSDWQILKAALPSALGWVHPMVMSEGQGSEHRQETTRSLFPGSFWGVSIGLGVSLDQGYEPSSGDPLDMSPGGHTCPGTTGPHSGDSTAATNSCGPTHSCLK